MKKLSVVALSLLFITGCAMTGKYTRTGRSAIVTDFDEAGMATESSVSTKRGEACSHNILGIASTGDSSIATAKANGGITRVSSVDYDVFNILMVYGKVCTIVRGE